MFYWIWGRHLRWIWGSYLVFCALCNHQHILHVGNLEHFAELENFAEILLTAETSLTRFADRRVDENHANDRKK